MRIVSFVIVFILIDGRSARIKSIDELSTPKAGVMKQQDTDADRGGPQRDSSDVCEHSIMTIFTCTCICAYTHTRKDINTPTQIRMHAFTEDLQLLMDEKGQAELRLADTKLERKGQRDWRGCWGSAPHLPSL